MKPLPTLDSQHLEAAQGWLDLGNHVEANEELEQIEAKNRAHPDVLQVRWRIYAKAGKSDACLDIATALTRMTPDRRFGCLHRVFSLRKLDRTAKAKDVLVSERSRARWGTDFNPEHLGQKLWFSCGLHVPGCRSPFCALAGNRLFCGQS